MIKLPYDPWILKAQNLYVFQTNTTYNFNFPRWRAWLKSTFNCSAKYDVFDGQILVFETNEDAMYFKLMVS